MNIPPSREQVKNIFKETYMLFVEYSDISADTDFKEYLKKTHALSKKYPFELCGLQILGISNILDNYAKEVN